MTTTKLAYLIAAIVPFGFVVLGAIALVHTFLRRRKTVMPVQPVAL